MTFRRAISRILWFCKILFYVSFVLSGSIITLLGEEGAVLTFNIHTSYFSHV